MNNLSTELIKMYKKTGVFLAGCVLFLSLIVLFGWASGNYDLVHLIPDLRNLGMKGVSDQILLPLAGQVNSTTALSLFLLSIGLLSIRLSKRLWHTIFGRLLAIYVVVGGIAGIRNEITGEELLSFRVLRPEPSAPGVTFPNPIMIPEAICLILLGLALLLFLLNRKAIIISQTTAIASMAIPVLIILGFATGSPQLCTMGSCFQMSIAFSLLILMFAGSILLSSSEGGFVSLIASRSTGGKILRRAVLLILLFPYLLVLRWALVSINYHGDPLVENSLSWAIVALIFLAATSWIMYTGAKAADSAEIFKEEISEQLEEIKDLAAQSTSFDQSQSFTRICVECGTEFDAGDSNNCPFDGFPLVQSEKLSLIGKVFAEKYQIEKDLGEGGMSNVYKARHIVLEKDFAIKILRKSTISSSESLERFKREAKVASTLDHPAIVGIQDFGVSNDGLPYIAMEYIEGESLDEIIEKELKLPLSRAISIIGKICEALSEAHRKGIVHRDLKPSNIMLVKDKLGNENIKIVDFGIAKILSDDLNKSQQLTQTGESMGSPLYMSPEQCRGISIDQRSDIYSLACLTFYALAGYPPIFKATIADTMAAHLKEEPSAFPNDNSVPDTIQNIIYKSLNKDASSRHNNVLAFRDDLVNAAKASLKN